MDEIDVDDNNRPFDPPYIIDVDVLWNPISNSLTPLKERKYRSSRKVLFTKKIAKSWDKNKLSSTIPNQNIESVIETKTIDDSKLFKKGNNKKIGATIRKALKSKKPII